MEDAAGGLTEFGYDEAGRLIWVEDANDRRTYYEYDKSDRHSATTLPEGQRSEIFYDSAGNVVSTTNFNGTNIVYEYEYDLEGSNGSQNPTGRRSNSGRAYTATGQIANITDALGTTAYEYDSLDRLVSRTDPSGSYIPSSGATIEYKYDEAGNIAAVTTPTGTVEYSYDERNRLETVTGLDGGNPTIYSYDEVGNLIETKLPNGVTETRFYDDRDRLISLEYTKLNSSGDKEAIASYDYTLDSVGNRLAVREGSDRKVEYEYDDLYRVTQETIYNESGSIERTISHSYDNLGNILTRQDSVEGTTSYTYDDSERLQAAELKKDGAVVSTYSYEYDSNGNLISRLKDGSEEFLYSWDAKNRLVGFEEVLTGRSVDYAYDADGIRVSSTTDGKKTNYLVDKNRDHAQVLSEQIDEQLTASYVYGLDLISQERDDHLSFYQVDGLGSTRALTDPQGNVTDTYRYDAYGNLLGSTGNTANNYLYAGEQYDPNLGNYYLRARYYDPSLGRFNARDPFGGWLTEPLSLGKYSYAHANPVNLTDPSGLSVLSLESKTALQLGAYLAAGSLVTFSVIQLFTKDRGEPLPDVGGFNENPAPPPSNHTGHDGPVERLPRLGGFNDGPRERFSDNTASPPGWKEGIRELLERYLFTIFNEDAYDIAYGHAFEKHKFDSWRHLEIDDPLELAELIDNIMTFPSDVRELEDSRTAYWDDKNKVVVIHDPADSEKGTAFIPSDGKQYFYDIE